MTALSGTNPLAAHHHLPERWDAAQDGKSQRWLCWSLAGLLHVAIFALSPQHPAKPWPQAIQASLRPMVNEAIKIAQPSVAPPPAAPTPSPRAPRMAASRVQQAAAVVPAPVAGEGHRSQAAPEVASKSVAAPAQPAVAEARFDASYLQNPKPSYPLVSRRQGEEGTVQLRVRVSRDGRPLEVRLKTSSGFPRLDQAAQAAVEGWRFQPATRGDEAIESWVAVPIKFSLTSPA